jgi:predicted Zn-dependent protease
VIAAAAVALPAALPTPALAAGVRIIRDAETEALLQDYAAPIFKAAGIASGSIEILIIPDRNFNAFVADGRKMFINTGAILEANTPNELIGVIAHESGHLAGGHLVRLRQMIDDTKIATLIAAALGLGAAMAAGAATGNTDFASAGAGIIAGVGSTGMRSILSYQRAQEESADRSAINYLNATHQSPAGMLAVFQRFANEALISSQYADPYKMSHPLARDRIAQIEHLVASSPYRDRTDPPALQLRHELVRAKLAAYTLPTDQVGRMFPEGDTSLPARYARAILTYRFGSVDSAVQQFEALIRAKPDYAYFWEIKGEALLDGGHATEAVAALRHAVSLAPRSGLLKVTLGQALVETDNSRSVHEAIDQLNAGIRLDPNYSLGYRMLARAYAATGDVAMAQLATAEGLFADGEIEEAKMQAGRAQAKLSRGSAAWLRADDILSYNPPQD